MIGLLLVASLAVTFVLSSVLQRIITRPIFNLARTAKTVSQEKNYRVRAQKESRDELGQLMDDFNEMLDQIEHRDVALRCANDDLEKRVQERTENLRLEIIERTRAERELQQQFTRISLLNQITQAISERQDLESILHVVLRQLEDHVVVDFGCVSLFDPQAETLNMAALRVKNPLLTAKMDLHEGSVLSLSEAALTPCKQGETIYLPDTLKVSSSLAERLAHGAIRSAVIVPLMVEHKLLEQIK
jgi:nitrate/nitrite-specific signal transduction histidine kinase